MSTPDGEFAALEAALKDEARAVEAMIESLLPDERGPYGRVIEAMRYAAFAGGKRLRPFLVLEGARLFGAERQGALRVAAAIELLHTYSLVHDDLPCMDDDDLRRGKPTTHRAFDEATAVLAGDGLLTFAFEILAHPDTSPDGAVRSALVLSLARAAGAHGMIGGQMMDILAPDRAYDRAAIIQLQNLKTGALFAFSAEAGAILAGADAKARARMRDYALNMGLAFQIADDLIDVAGSAEIAGKAVGKDADQGKATLISLYGPEVARAEIHQLSEACRVDLEAFGERASRLVELTRYLAQRAH
jgi:farnesyl diphosphate synthase